MTKLSVIVAEFDEVFPNQKSIDDNELDDLFNNTWDTRETGIIAPGREETILINISLAGPHLNYLKKTWKAINTFCKANPCDYLLITPPQ